MAEQGETMSNPAHYYEAKIRELSAQVEDLRNRVASAEARATGAEAEVKNLTPLLAESGRKRVEAEDALLRHRMRAMAIGAHLREYGAELLEKPNT